MSLLKICAATFVLAGIIASQPAHAQGTEGQTAQPNASERGVFEGDWATLGIGPGYGPSYEGSDNYTILPAPIAQGSIGGFEFGARGPALYVDLIRDSNSDSSINFLAGPLVQIRFDRTRNIKDPVVRLLGEEDVAIEVGATAGVSFSKVLNPYDLLTITSDIQWDVADAHGGRLITPMVSYSTPLSEAIFTNLSISAIRVDGDYADTYFSVDAAGSAASGLPVFDADSGWKSYGATLLGGYDLSGDIRDGGWGTFALVGYSRLTGDAKRSPVTSIRGDADQWFLAAGVSYTF